MGLFQGHTLTSSVKFFDVIKTINEYAFVASPYPLILSIELHCSKPQQLKMAHYFVQVFKDRLAKPLTDPKITNLPSPKDLQYKVILKGKRIPTSTDHPTMVHNNSTPSSPAEEEEEEKEMEDEKLTKELSDLIYLNGTSKFKSFHPTHCWDMYSFNERKAMIVFEKKKKKKQKKK